MIGRSFKAPPQLASHIFGLLTSGSVDDGGATSGVFQRFCNSGEALGRSTFYYFDRYIVSSKTMHKSSRMLQFQLIANILLDERCCRRGECDDWCRTKRRQILP